MLQTGVVQNPAAAQYADQAQPFVTLGRQGDVLVTELHGKRYYKAARGKLFWANYGGAAGVSVIAAGQTAMTGAMLYNPATSGVYVEVEKIRITGATVETDVISGLGLEGSVQVPSAVGNATNINGMPLGIGATPLAKAYLSATIAAMTYIGGLGLNLTATTGPMPVGEVDFDGTLVLAPGFALNLVSSITQGTNKLIVDILWSEWLP